jgi:hypothetical protein
MKVRNQNGLFFDKGNQMSRFVCFSCLAAFFLTVLALGVLGCSDDTRNGAPEVASADQAVVVAFHDAATENASELTEIETMMKTRAKYAQTGR